MIRFELSNPLISAWILFGQTRDMVERLVSKTFATAPLTNEEYKVLLVVMNFPGQPSQRDIAEWLHRSPNAVSELLHRMEQKGLIAQTRDPVDRRFVRVASTEQGSDLYWEVSAIVWEMVSGALGSLEAEDLTTLSRLLEKVQAGVPSLLGNGHSQPQTIALDDATQLAALLERTGRVNGQQATSSQSKWL